MDSTNAVGTVKPKDRKVLIIFKARLSECLPGNVPDEAPLVYIPPAEATEEIHNAAVAVLSKHHVVSVCDCAASDWVELTYSQDDRESHIHPGDFVVTWDDQSLSVLHGVHNVEYGENGTINIVV